MTELRKNEDSRIETKISLRAPIEETKIGLKKKFAVLFELEENSDQHISVQIESSVVPTFQVFFLANFFRDFS